MAEVTDRPLLRELAHRCGIEAGYVGTDGAWHETSDASREALLAAMRVDASDEAAAARALADLPPQADGAPPPSPCLTAGEVLDAVGGRAFGLQANLYTLRSALNWGVGDLGDLRALIGWAAEIGAAFVGVNPLDALDERRADGNPYFPISRLFASWLYIDVREVPELADCAALRARMASSAFGEQLRALRDAAVLDWRELLDFKRAAMVELYEAFVLARRRGSVRGEAFEEFRRAHGRSLTDLATYCALAEHFGEGSSDWSSWPAALQRADAPAVAEFRRAKRDRVELFEYLQFETDRQLAAAAADARACGLRIGVFGDLPVGVAPGGSDVWSMPDRFVAGVRIGAPPDPYSDTGQDWGLAPLDPRTLLAAPPGESSYWRMMLDQHMRHCGSLRIDHAMGLVRQFWIPAGRPASEGAYVRYPTDAMIADLAAASHRHRCIVVGEDLGTVPEGFREQLRQWGILRNQILYFERRGADFAPPGDYDREALVAANTHDLPPLAGFWAGTDLELRAAGGVAGGENLDAARAARREEIERLRAVLHRHSITGESWQPASSLDLTAAVNELLSGAPSRLLAVAVDDLGGEHVPINVPSATGLQTPLWSRRMARSIEEVRGDAQVQRVFAHLDGRRR